METIFQVTDHQPDLPGGQQPVRGVGAAGAVLPRGGQVRCHKLSSLCVQCVCRYKIFIKTRLGEDWEVREVIVPPAAKHNVEKVRKVSAKRTIQ